MSNFKAPAKVELSDVLRTRGMKWHVFCEEWVSEGNAVKFVYYTSWMSLGTAQAVAGNCTNGHVYNNDGELVEVAE